jgi:signal transduction histidine kinase
MADPPPASILLVNPFRVHLEVLAQILNPEGHDLVCALSAAEALEQAAGNMPDLILIDAAPPELDGHAACRALRREPALSEVPVLLISGSRDPVEAFRAGAFDVIEKPFRPEVLLARVRTHLALHAAKRRLAEHKAEYEHLLHILCHDLWNPIAAVRGFVALARRAPMSEAIHQYCEGVESCLGHQEAIIERVRELRAIDAGKREAPLVPVLLRPAIASAAELFRARLESKRLQLERPEASSLSELAVWGEPVALTHHIICNLLSNAIKFSQPGAAIRIAVESDPHACTLIIQDEGIGIPAPILERLFRVDLATSRIGTAGERGTGFGMPLVKKVVEQFGGAIRVESQDEAEHPTAHGTSVRVWLRRAPAPDMPNR